MTLLKHPYSGLYYDDGLIWRYANAGEPRMSFEEAVDDLEREGFERVWPEDFPFDQADILAFLSMMVEIGRGLVEHLGEIAENVSRTANSIGAIAKQVPMMAPPSLTVEQVRERAGVRSVKTVYRWKEEGLLKPLADNVKPLLFAHEEVEDFIRRRRRGRRGN